jgi:hypothetical protein
MFRDGPSVYRRVMNTRARFGGLGTVLLLLCFTLGAPAVAASGKGGTTTTVAGAWQVTPAFIPTGWAAPPPACDVTSQQLGTLKGAFVGVWHEVSMRALCDFSKLPISLTYRISGTGTFEGIYFHDQSRVSLTWTGFWTGDAISGQSIGVFDFKSSDGCTFRLTFDGYVSFHTSFGGYNGKWVRGCRP